MPKPFRALRLRLEELESRLVPSVSQGMPDGDGLRFDNARPSGPAIKLDLVALHELGHALGLAHSNNANSIMYAYYNANYNKANLANDPAVVVNAGDGYSSLLELFSAAAVSGNTTSWKDSLDLNPGNGVVNVTYSFMPDGTKVDGNKSSTMFSKFNALYGGTQWQTIIAGELNRWASVSGGKLSFSLHSDNGGAFNSGVDQNSPNFGDIRVGAHRFDGAGKVLAHTYYPPPNGGSAAGDAHFDDAENWDNLSAALTHPNHLVTGSGNGSAAAKGDALADGGDLVAASFTAGAGQSATVARAAVAAGAAGSSSVLVRVPATDFAAASSGSVSTADMTTSHSVHGNSTSPFSVADWIFGSMQADLFAL